MNQTELERLLRNPNKWNTMKAKRMMLKTIPGLAKGWKHITPGGRFATFELGRHATEKLVEQFTGEGAIATAAGVGGGLLAQKKIYNKVSKKLSEKLATPAGKKWMFNKIAKMTSKRIATAALTGAAVGGGTPLSAATGIIGTLAGVGMAGYDIYDLFFRDEEGEE